MKPHKFTSDPAFAHRQLCRCGETKNQDWHLVCEKCWLKLPCDIKNEVYNACLHEEGSERHKRAMAACFEVLDAPEVCVACLGWVGCNCPDCIKERSEEVQEVVTAMQKVIVERDKAREYANELTAAYLEAYGKLQDELALLRESLAAFASSQTRRDDPEKDLNDPKIRWLLEFPMTDEEKIAAEKGLPPTTSRKSLMRSERF